MWPVGPIPNDDAGAAPKICPAPELPKLKAGATPVSDADGDTGTVAGVAVGVAAADIAHVASKDKQGFVASVVISAVGVGAGIAAPNVAGAVPNVNAGASVFCSPAAGAALKEKEGFAASSLISAAGAAPNANGGASIVCSPATAAATGEKGFAAPPVVSAACVALGTAPNI